MKKIRAKLLSSGDVLVSVTTAMRTDKHRVYETTEHYELQPAEAEVLLYDLHTVVETLRGMKKKTALRHRLAEKLRR